MTHVRDNEIELFYFKNDENLEKDDIRSHTKNVFSFDVKQNHKQLKTKLVFFIFWRIENMLNPRF
jgi:hypothetical protein